jgi:hypothetical protein
MHQQQPANAPLPMEVDEDEQSPEAAATPSIKRRRILEEKAPSPRSSRPAIRRAHRARGGPAAHTTVLGAVAHLLPQIISEPVQPSMAAVMPDIDKPMAEDIKDQQPAQEAMDIESNDEHVEHSVMVAVDVVPAAEPIIQQPIQVVSSPAVPAAVAVPPPAEAALGVQQPAQQIKPLQQVSIPALPAMAVVAAAPIVIHPAQQALPLHIQQPAVVPARERNARMALRNLAKNGGWQAFVTPLPKDDFDLPEGVQRRSKRTAAQVCKAKNTYLAVALRPNLALF